MARFYFAEFTNTETGETFQKFGHTREKDAQVRLNHITEAFPKFTATVLASAYHHSVEKCQGAEEAFQVVYPKNFWLEEKISGITECVILERDIRNQIIKMVMNLNKKFKKECFG